MIRRNAALVLVGALTLALAACVPAGDDPSPAPTSAASETPAPTSSSEPEPTLTIGPEGLGGFVLGAAPDAAAVAAYAVFDPDLCLEVAAANGNPYPEDRDPGRWRPTVSSAPHAFSVQIQNGVVTRVDAVVPFLATAEGILVGSSAADVAAAYPDAEIVPFPASDVVVVTGDAGLLLIEIARDHAGGWEPDEVDTVIGLNATIAEIGVFAIARTDNRAGEC